ncbi:MAG: DUF6440 family protein [Eubacteriales bacterium]
MGYTDDRFVKTYSQSQISRGIEIWVDKETGVNYVFRFSGYAGGMTVLLDAEGKPVVTPQKKQ